MSQKQEIPVYKKNSLDSPLYSKKGHQFLEPLHSILMQMSQERQAISQEKINNMVQTPYNLVKKLELGAIVMVLCDFPESLNIVTDSQYAESVALHSEPLNLLQMIQD